MRLSSLLLLGATALTGAGAIRGKLKADDEEGNTYFNGIKVPPILEITPDNFEKEVHASKFLVVKHFSPYCPHCIDFLPTFQTLYEYYYTSTPDTDPDATFTDFYDVRFATMNCIAFYDLCQSLEVKSYPSTNIFKDGKIMESITGVKSLETLTEKLEPILEHEKPGSRPEQLFLPKPGEKQTSDFNAASQITADAGPGNTNEAKEDQKDTKPAIAAVEKPLVNDISIEAKSAETAESAETYNPDGVSVALDPESFHSLVTTTQNPWFIKFYAPWCHHCQAMAPNWQQLGKEMKGKLNIGEVNCEKEKRLCKDVDVKGFPTLLFFKGAERIEYQGMRGLGDFVQFAEKAADAATGVLDVDAASLEALEQKEEVIFVYFYDHATTSEDFAALERLPLSVVGRAKVVKTKDPELYKRYKISTFPRLLVSREGRPTYHNPLTPREMRDVNGILAWMKSVWLPIVPELVASNSREITDGKIVVLGILNRGDPDSFAAAKHELKTAANEWMDKQILAFQQERQELRNEKQLRIDEAEDRNDERALRNAKAIRIDMNMSDKKEVAFAWADGVFWQRWIKTTYGIDVQEGNRVIINDEDRHRFWDTTISGNNILVSRSSILETVSKIVTSPPQIKAKLTISRFEKFFFDIRMAFVDHPFLSVGAVLTAVLGAAAWLRIRTRRNRGGQFVRTDDSWSTKELMKEGLLGGGANGNGKVD